MMVNTEHNVLTASLGITKNLGNFESVRIDVSATVIDKDPNDGKAWEELWSAVDDQLDAKLTEVEEVLGVKESKK
jgi:hypothetical protein